MGFIHGAPCFLLYPPRNIIRIVVLIFFGFYMNKNNSEGDYSLRVPQFLERVARTASGIS